MIFMAAPIIINLSIINYGEKYIQIIGVNCLLLLPINFILIDLEKIVTDGIKIFN